MTKSSQHVTGPLTKLIIFIAITVLTTAVLGISIANVNLSKTNTYKARFSDATLLLVNDDVRIAGVRVGQVSDVQVVDKHNAEVTFAVDASKRLPTSTTATVRFRNLVGQRYVALEPGRGDPSQLLANDGSGTIPMEQTKPALDLTELFNGFRPLFTALTPEDVNKLSYEIIRVFQGEGGTMESLLAHTASLTNTIAEKDQIIGEVITNLNDVLTAVNAKTPELNDTIDKMQQLVTGLAQDREPIGQAVQSLGDLATTTAGFLGEARKPLKDDIKALGDLSKLLNDHEAVVEHFIQFMPFKLKTITRTASYGSWFNFYNCKAEVALRLNSQQAEPIMIPLGDHSEDRERC